MVAETRAARIDLYARTKFTKEGDAIEESRTQIEAACEVEENWQLVVERAASQLATAFEAGEVEMG
jgi:hypothetical protein